MRITVSKSKKAESFYITHSYVNKQGKSTSTTYKKLGSLADLKKQLGTDSRDEVMAWCQEQCRIETEKYKKENEVVLVSLSPNKLIEKDKPRTFNCGYLFLQDIYYQLRFDNIVRNISSRHKFEYSLDSILSDLVYARILNPSSKQSSYEYCKNLLEAPKYELHDVYRALSVLAEESDYIQSELYKNSQFIHNRDKSVLYYDCTNYYFEIEEEDELRKYGKSKENRPNPIVGMGMFMDSDGIPLAFDIYPGNQNEQKTLKPLEKKIIKDFDCSNFIYCSDSGLGSLNNRKFNSMGGRAYVITQSLKKLKKEDRDIALDPTGWKVPGGKKPIDLRELDETSPAVIDTVYYKEVNLETDALPDQSLIVTYSVKYKKYQAAIREGQIQRARKMIESGSKIKKTHRNPNDPARFISKTSVTESGEVADKEFYAFDENKVKEEAMYDGFYAVVTDLLDDPAQIIEVNKRRWQIEECFRIMKTEFKSRPVYLSLHDRIKAHFLTCFISLVVYRLLEIKLGNNYTCDKTISTLRGMNVTEIEGYGYIPSYTRTELTDKLHDLAGFRTDTQIIKKLKMRNIIKKSKEK